MNREDSSTVKSRIDKIRKLTEKDKGTFAFWEAVSIAKSVLYDTVGGSHPIMRSLEKAISSNDYIQGVGASRAVVELYDQDALKSPRLAIAAEIETDILVTAQSLVQAAETNLDQDSKTIQIAIAAFLAGSALEDALRRLCDVNQLPYETDNTSISKLQSVLYQPSKQIEIIGRSDSKQITVWGDTRNKADHGKFKELTFTEVVSMIMGVQSFINRYLVQDK